MVKTFSDVLRSALGVRLEESEGGFIDMLAEDAVMEFPFSPPGMPTRLEGREALAHHLSLLGGLIAFDEFGDVQVYDCADPAIVILEFTANGRGLQTGAPYRQRYVSIIRTQAGRIVRYTDYWNPLAVLTAVGDNRAYENAARKAAVAAVLDVTGG